jgi:hypothetical protein
MDDLQLEVLKNKVRQDLERVSGNVEDMEKSLKEVASEWLLSTAQAQLLCQFYTGLESIFEKGLKLLEVLPSSKGDQHHKDVLNAAQTANLYPEACRALMLDLLGFRHFSRHGYGMILRPGEVEKKTESVVAEWPSINQHIVTVLSLEKLPPEESTNEGTE